MKRTLCWLITGLLLLWPVMTLVACGGESSKPTDSESATESETAIETETAPESETAGAPAPESESHTAAETAPDTETETTPESATETAACTEPLPPEETAPETLPETEATDPNVWNTAGLSPSTGGLFSRPQNCAGDIVEDPDMGTVLRLSTTDISSVGTTGPQTNLSLKKLSEALGKELPDTREFPFLVLKVRSGDVWSRLFRVYGGDRLLTAIPRDDAKLIHAYLKNTNDWQYIFFDLSGIEEAVHVLHIRFELAAGKNGESVDIAEFRFLSTQEEAIALCGPDTYELAPSDGTLRIISYNIWVGGGTNTTVRADILRDVIDTYKPDSIGMQEVTLAWKDTFERFVFNDSYAGVGEGRSDSYEACLLYYRVDKYELVDSGTFWLSDTPDVKGSLFPESLYPRICTWAHLRDRATGFEYVHINTHLDHLGGGSGGNELRGKQTEVLLEFVNKLGDLPLVMTGDFNTNPSNGQGALHPAYAYITGQKSFEADGTTIKGPFADARIHADKTVPADKTATMTRYYDEGGNPSHPPIDYHFYTPSHFHPLSYETFIFERDGVPLSDHLALICDYRISAEAE